MTTKKPRRPVARKRPPFKSPPRHVNVRWVERMIKWGKR